MAQQFHTRLEDFLTVLQFRGEGPGRWCASTVPLRMGEFSAVLFFRGQLNTFHMNIDVFQVPTFCSFDKRVLWKGEKKEKKKKKNWPAEMLLRPKQFSPVFWLGVMFVLPASSHAKRHLLANDGFKKVALKWWWMMILNLHRFRSCQVNETGFFFPDCITAGRSLPTVFKSHQKIMSKKKENGVISNKQI